MPKYIPNELRAKAIEYRHHGYSLNEVMKATSLPKSTIWYLIRNIKLENQSAGILRQKIETRGFKPNNTHWQKKKIFQPNFLWPPERIVQLITLYNSGLSMKETAQELGTTLNSVSSVMRRKHIPMRSPAETNRIRFYKSPLSFNPKTNLTEKEEQLKVAGLMLYWGEGAKRHDAVNFTNSDPKMIFIFCKFLRKIYRVDESRLRASLYCFNDQEPAVLTSFWSKLTHITPSQFIKPYVRPAIPGKHGKIRYGCLHIRYSDKRLFRLLLREMDQAISKF